MTTSTIDLHEIPVHQAAKLLPMMGKAELRALADDINDNGLQEPLSLYTDADGTTYLLDGRNRREALKLLNVNGIEEIPVRNGSDVVNHLGSDVDPTSFVLSMNVRRRHLTSEQKRVTVKEYLKRNPTTKDREVARALGVAGTTVADVRKEIQAAGILQSESNKPGERVRSGLLEDPALAELSAKEGGKKFDVSPSMFSTIRKELRELGEIPTPEPKTPAKEPVELTSEEQADVDAKQSEAEAKRVAAAEEKRTAAEAKRAAAVEKTTTKLINQIGVQITELIKDSERLAKLTLTPEQASVITDKVRLLHTLSVNLQAAATSADA